MIYFIGLSIIIILGQAYTLNRLNEIEEKINNLPQITEKEE